jgi:hypothetical protein
MVTSAPNEPKTCPSSAAMKPPPMISREPGTRSTRMMVSEVWNGTRSRPGIAGTAGREPTDTTIRSAVSCSPPTSSTPGAVKRAGSV